MTTASKTRPVKGKVGPRSDSCSRWIRVCVDTFEHGALDDEPYCSRAAWIWLIAQAAHKERRFNHKGKVITLPRGHVLIGRAYLAKAWGWTERRVRTFLARLQRDGMLAISDQSDGHYANIASICNYDKYQIAYADDSQTIDQRATRGRPDLNSGTMGQDSEEKIETPIVGVPTPPAPAKKKASRLPEDWTLPPEWRVEFAKTFNVPGYKIDEQARLFFNYWTSKSGKDACKLNWKRTFENWLINARERTTRGMNGKVNGHHAPAAGYEPAVVDGAYAAQSALIKRIMAS